MESTQQSNLDQQAVLKLLTELDQTLIISEFNKESRTEEERQRFIGQVNKLETVYPGGLREYVNRGKVLLNNSKNNVNPYANYKPSVPEGAKIQVGNEEFFSLESTGFNELQRTCFILVAGGLGERLGYDDIKIGIATDLLTSRPFFQVYVDTIKAYEARLRREFNMSEEDFIPLCIMTSDDTHSKTVDFLKQNNNFGLRQNQIEIVKQDKVPSLLDNDCHFALMSEEFLIDTKPHGHGDIHTLVHQFGVADRWIKMNKKWVVFIQDTNMFTFNPIPTALAVSLNNGFVVNTITIPRKPKEAVGAICKLTDESNNNSITLNVEYNQLDALLRDKYNANGDVANEHGLSDFPGNTNVLVFSLAPYNDTLKRTSGLIPEFVNPKYADDSKTTFKSPTRLECMMQDFPKLFENNEKVGFTMYDRWFCFSTCKNNLKDGVDKLVKNLVPETAFSIEQDIFATNKIILRDVLNKLEIEDKGDKESVEIMGVKVNFDPKIIIHPSFACSLEELREKIGKITMTNDSVLILKDGKVADLKLNGFLQTEEGTTEGEVTNATRYSYVTLKEGEGRNYEKIRGYTLKISN